MRTGMEIMDAHTPCSGLYACSLLAGRVATRRGKEVWLPVVAIQAILFPTAGRFPAVSLRSTVADQSVGVRQAWRMGAIVTTSWVADLGHLKSQDSISPSVPPSNYSPFK